MTNPQPTPGDNGQTPLNDLSVEELQKQLLIEQINAQKNTHSSSKTHMSKKAKLIVIISAVAVIALILVSVTAVLVTRSKAASYNGILASVSDCKQYEKVSHNRNIYDDYMSAKKDGSSMQVTYHPYRDKKLIDCVAAKTGMSDTLKDEIVSPELIAGRQGSKDWGKYHAEWSAWLMELPDTMEEYPIILNIELKQ
jgi:hypothetical protein